MIKNLGLSLTLYVVSFGIIALYTIIIYFAGHNLWPQKASGSLILDDSKNVRGSYLLAQNLPNKKYFRSRSYTKFDNECDVALYNSKLKNYLINNYDKTKNHHDVTMLSPSANYYDPFITRQEAMLQAPAVAKARNMDVKELYKLIDENSLYSQKPFFELEIVNVMLLNTKLNGYKIIDI